MPRQEAEQLVLDQMDKDPSRRQGVRTIQAKVAFESSHHLGRDFVSEIMHTHDDTGFAFRDPSSKKTFRVKRVPIGIHERWAADGHDKLCKIGFPVWAVVDDATAKWLGAWVVPNNRMGHVVAYLYLCLVELFGGEFAFYFLSVIGFITDYVLGMPLQFSTDCGTETTQIYGLGNALRSVFFIIFIVEAESAALSAYKRDLPP